MSARILEIEGHRGARGLLPENTLPAFERAIALGVDALEFDVGMTRDGIPVVHHDPALDPDHTRDAGGAWLAPPGARLGHLDMATLSGFDVGRARPGGRTFRAFPHQKPSDGARIPTLAEVLTLGRQPGADTVRFSIEIKLSPLVPEKTAGPEAFADAVVAVLRAKDMLPRASVRAFDWRVLHEIRKRAPAVPVGCLTAEQSWLDNILRDRPGPSPWTAGLNIHEHGDSVPRMVRAFGGPVWSPHYSELNAESLAEARDLGLKVVVWTVNEVRDMLAMARLGVDGIVTDYPDRALQALAPWRQEAPQPA